MEPLTKLLESVNAEIAAKEVIRELSAKVNSGIEDKVRAALSRSLWRSSPNIPLTKSTTSQATSSAPLRPGINTPAMICIRRSNSPNPSSPINSCRGAGSLAAEQSQSII